LSRPDRAFHFIAIGAGGEGLPGGIPTSIGGFELPKL
jgi:hypothetical protein